MKKRVLIIEDELLVAEEIKIICELNGFVVSSICDNYSAALKYFAVNDIDIVISDVFIKGDKTGLDFLNRISFIKLVPVILITAFSSETIISGIIPHHNVSYVTKPFTSEQLVSVLKIADMCGFNHNNCYELTPREHQIIANLVKGKSNEEIAADLFLSPQTVKTHRKTIFHKLNVSSVTQLVNKVTCKGV